MLHDLEKALLQLRQLKPLVLCLTNQVTMDFMANCLLSIGAAPIMSQDGRELEELIRMSHAVNINIGTLDRSFMERANTTAQLAQKYKKPIILDPVGAGATHVRTASSRALMDFADIVRGNASEIMAISNNANTTLGVESAHQVNDATQSATQLALNHQCIIVVSGEHDVITNGQQEARLTYGSSLMPFITGMGCTLTAVIAAFRAVVPCSFTAARLATAYFTLCGSLAAQKTSAPGSFRTCFIDELYSADFTTMRSIPHAT
jgi:hydroxyethylthiazole kinase